MFKFKDIPDVYKHEIFKNHSLQVMQSIEKTIQNLADLEHMKATTIPKCEDKNQNRGVTPQLGKQVCECLMMTLQ